MNVLCQLAVVGTASNKAELVYIWDQATPEAKAIIVFLILFSIMAWSVMTSKAVQLRRARKLNQFFGTEFKTQKAVLEMFDRRIQADAMPTGHAVRTYNVLIAENRRVAGAFVAVE